MRINKYIAQSTGLSRRKADELIAANRVTVNDTIAQTGQEVTTTDIVAIDKRAITPIVNTVTIMLNKPIGYVCSRDGQGSKTIYDLLPAKYHQLKPVGRLDKDSSGLLLLTNNGDLAYKLSHPSFEKTKVYHLALDKPISLTDKARIEQGVELEDGFSALSLKGSGTTLQASLHEGRNRQVRRTFETLGYTVIKLHRTQFGNYRLDNLQTGKFKELPG